MVRSHYYRNSVLKWNHRIINAELRQPKSERGEKKLPRTLKFVMLNHLMTDRQTFNSALAATLTKSIHTMLTHTSSERGRAAVPLITDASGISPFPIKITVKIGGMEIG